MAPDKTFKVVRVLCVVMFVGAVSACSIIPKPLLKESLQAQANEDKEAITYNQEPVSGPISLYEATARALKYNLDLHLELAEKILAKRELDVSRYELLPQLVTNLGYNSRDNFSGASSRSLLTGVQSLQSSTSSDRDLFTADLNLSWNVLDFGVSYFRAHQAADRVLIAEEEKRKVINRMIKDVNTAYWRAVTNDRLITELETLSVRVAEAIEESKQVEHERLDRPLTALTYQRELIGIKRELQRLHRDLSIAKNQLAALMNLRPGEEFQIVIPERRSAVKTISMSPQMMEQLALENRPELHEIAYEKRINAQEAKAAILSLLPGIDLNFGKNYSSNSFLFNTNWLSYGSRISWNLLNVFKLPATNRELEARDKVLDARRLALSMAILTQVHVGLVQYEHAKLEYETAAEYFHAQEKILKQIQLQSESDSVSKQSLIREEMNMLVAEVKYDISYSDLENAYAGIFSAIGLDPLPKNLGDENIDELEDSLKERFDALSSYGELFSMLMSQGAQ